MTDEILDIYQYLIQNLPRSKQMAEPGKPSGYVSGLDITKLEFVGDDFEYSDVKKTPLDDPLYVDSITRTNDTDVDQTIELDRSYKSTATFTWSVTKGIKNAGSISVGCKLPMGVNISAQYSFELSTTTTQAQSDSVEQTWEVKTAINAPSRSKVITDVVINEANFKSTFKFNGELRGKIKFIGWVSPKGTDPNLGIEFEDDITEFIPGMPLPPELSMVKGKLIFNGTGTFTGVAGIDVDAKSTQYPLKSIQKKVKLS